MRRRHTECAYYIRCRPLLRAPARNRRGVLILVVLSLLILFVVIAVMFVAVATRARSVANTYSNVGRTGDAPRETLDNVLFDILRGSTNPYSPFRNHSLLEDTYGHLSIRGQVSVFTLLQGGIADVDTSFRSGPAGEPRIDGFSPVKDAYSGCVLTFVTGNLRGVSARILEYWPAGTRTVPFPNPSPGFRLMLLASEHGRDFWPASIGQSEFVINGRPFSGTGVGYNADAGSPGFGRLTAVEPPNDPATGATGQPYALLPNPVFFTPNIVPDVPPRRFDHYLDPSGAGGANEDYDAPDYHNLFLGYYASPILTDTRQIKPSFHDPALIDYWTDTLGNFFAAKDAHVWRKVMLRPNPTDHPRFPALGDAVVGPWDIDNDGDGLTDSVWIDPGYPVLMTKQGKLYKALVAPLVLDLDGRLNLNAHGSVQELVPPTAMPSAQTTAPTQVLAGGMTIANPPRGSGVGPAEIRLDAVLGNNTSAILQARYGQDGAPGYGGSGATGALPMAPQSSPADAFSIIRQLSVPDNWPGMPGGPGGISTYGSPPDLKGRLAVALDPTGQPVWDKTNWTNEPSDPSDDPYELDLSRYSARAIAPLSPNGPPYDGAFSMGELERVLRPFDMDSGTLPPRLALLLNPTIASRPFLRNEVTTDSWDPPVPSLVASPSMRGFLGNATIPGRMTSIAELLHARLSVAGVQPGQIPVTIEALLSPEVRRGLRMNLNRQFGNGRDDGVSGQQGNGIVDDAGETGDTMPYHFPPINGPQAVPFDQVNGQDVNFDGKSDATDRYLARQLLARHLYVLMMLCADDQFKFPLSTVPASPGNQVPQWGMPTEGLSPQQRSELKAKRLAQWAVNVVDFMDSDNIMTGFEFDMNPFNGWEVDSNLATPDDPAAAKGERGTTFGCEMPVAILTETLAFHARRVQDTEHDDETESKRDDQNNPDQTLDQALIPRGSAFVEIMAIFNANVGVMSGDLFVFEQNEWKLDLGKMAPAGPLGPAKPVWRLAVSDFHTPHETDTSEEREPVSDIISEHPDTVSLQPFVESDWGTIQPPAMSRWNMTLLNQMPDRHNLPIERIVWMAGAAPQGPEAAYTFHALTNTNARLGGFQYAVVGPGGTGAGDRTSGTVNGITIGWRSDDAVAQTQQISIEGAVSVQRSEKTYPAVGTAIKPALGIPVASPAGQVKTWDAERPWGANIRVGFSISEPLFSDATRYYPRPSETNADTGLQEAYGDEADDTKKYLDKPLDSEDPDEPGRDMPLAKRDMLSTGTYMNVRTVFLQRLADPTQAHHPQTNPYITVDWMPFDLTVFNGEDKKPTESMLDDWDPDDTTPVGVRFMSRERGEQSTARTGMNTDYNVWRCVFEHPKETMPEANASASYFPYRLVHTLGYLNSSYGEPQPSPSPYHVGGPAKPFPWIRWNNRPFTSALELMEVPASTPGRLLMEFNYVVPGTSNSPYDTSPNSNPRARQFTHLLNFFHASDPSNRNAETADDFYQIFEFVHVPSPFVGTETMLDPSVFQTPAMGTAPIGTEGLRAPFNWVSNYREPGKVNLNTINSPSVFDAVMGVQQGQQRIRFGEFWNYRRGGGPPAGGEVATSPVRGTPTSMVNVFRSGAAGDMVPDVQQAANQDGLKRSGVSLTILRQEGEGAAATGAPLFANPARDPNATQQYADANRNAAFRYQSLQRLGNLTTTRSNVFAVWLTVGYFEVFPNPSGVDVGHPDGYQLGAELGSDTGEIERHRAFYIIDRSIPVGFERGFNHNVDRAILLKRFIE